MLEQMLKRFWVVSGMLYLGFNEWMKPLLPALIVTKLNSEGRPMGFGSKSSFFGFSLGMFLFSQAVLVLLFIFMPKIPRKYINVPNKDYWFGDATRIRFLRDRIAGVASIIGIFLSLVFFLISYAVYRTNSVTTTPLQPGRIVEMMTALQIVGVLAIIAYMMPLFKKPA